MNGDWKKELAALKIRNQKYMQVLTKCSLSRREVKVIYRQCYVPAVTYPLPASVIPQGKLYDKQKSITTAFLAKTGYPRTFPWAVVFAPKTQGGIGLCHLGAKQGTQKILQVLKHMRAKTSIGTIYQVLINQYQLNSGFSEPILEATTPIPWSQAYWVDTLCTYLTQIQGTVILHQPWTPKERREHDKPLMVMLLQANLPLSTHEYKLLNNVRIHLQATMLSDICNHTGTHIRQECLQATPMLPNRPQYYHCNHSTLKWPQHATPQPANWRLWSRTIKKLYSTSNNTKLTKPLGKWTMNYKWDYKWTWTICPTTFNLYHQQNTIWMVY